MRLRNLCVLAKRQFQMYVEFNYLCINNRYSNPQYTCIYHRWWFIYQPGMNFFLGGERETVHDTSRGGLGKKLLSAWLD